MKEVRIMGSKSALLRTIVAASSAKTTGFAVSSFVPKWRPVRDSNPQLVSTAGLEPARASVARSRRRVRRFRHAEVKLEGTPGHDPGSR